MSEWTLQTDQRYVVTVTALAGTGFANLRMERDGQAVDIPVVLGGVFVHPDYAHQWRQVQQHSVYVGAQLVVRPTGVAYQGSLPVFEILDDQNRPMSVYAVTQGWAVPQASIAYTTTLGDQYVAALQHARTAERGIWGDAVYRPILESELHEQLLIDTAPPESGTTSLAEMGSWITVTIMICFTFFYIAAHRLQGTPTTQVDIPERPRVGLIRFIPAYMGWTMRFIARNGYRSARLMNSNVGWSVLARKTGKSDAPEATDKETPT